MNIKQPVLLYLLLSGFLSFSQKTKEIVPETEAQKTQRFVLESLIADGMRFETMEDYGRADSVLRKALALSPNLAALNYEMAKVLVKQDKVDEAAIFAQKAYDIDSQNKYYLVQLAEVSIQQRKYNKAADLYKEIIDRSTENAEYGFELASVYLLDDRYEDAIKVYNNIEKIAGINEGIVHQKQRIYIKINKIDKAIAEAEKLISSDPMESKHIVELAQLYFMTGKTAEATTQLERALVVNPDEADAQLMLAEIYKKNGNTKAADQQMEVMFGNPNADIEIKIQALNAMMRSNKIDSQKEVLSRAQELIKAHPKDTRAYTIYADLLMQNGQKAESRNEYVKVTKIDKSISQVWGAILQLDSELNQTDSLIAHSEQALELFPNNGLFWYSNGTGYLMKRNYVKAVEALEEAQRWSSKNPELSNAIYAQLGDAYNGATEYEKSDEAYENALKGNPDNDHVMNNYSYFLSLRKQKLARAKELGAKVVERNPDNATFLDTYAWVLYVMKDYGQAKQYLEKAVGGNKTVSSTIVEHYGDVLFRLGEKEKALEQWKKAKSIGKNNSELDKKIETGVIVE